LPATVAAAAAVAAETVACHCCQQLMQLLGVSVAAAAVDDVGTVVAVFEPWAAGPPAVQSHCTVVERPQDDAAAAADDSSWLSFLQRLTNEVQSV